MGNTKINNLSMKKTLGLSKMLHKRESAMFLSLLILLLIMSLLRPKTFFTADNLFNITKQISIIAIVAVGQSYVLMTGGIDLSVGYSVGLSGICAAIFLDLGITPPLAILLAIGVSVLVGIANGLLITSLKLPPFIITLGLANIVKGLTYVITKGFPVPISNSFILELGNGYFGPIPIMTIVMILVVAIAAYLLRRNIFGTRVLSIGGNETAALLSGIKVKRYKTVVYSLTGLLCGIAGIIMAGRLNSGNPNAGLSMDMDTIAAAIVGGTSLSGGDGTIIGTLLGALLLGVIRNSLVLLKVNMYWQTVVIGVVIIAVCGLDKRAQSKREI